MSSNAAGAHARAARPSPRERLLTAANELFYAEGVQSVGIDRIIDRADVARASLYSTFGSKDELVRAYLERRMEISTARLRAAIEAHTDPRERLLSVFDVQATLFGEAGFRGCAFNRATAEARPGSAAAEVPRRTGAGSRSCSRSWPPRPGLPIPSCSAARFTCCTTAGCWRRAWTRTRRSPRPPRRPPGLCSTPRWPVRASPRLSYCAAPLRGGTGWPGARRGRLVR